MPVGFEASLVAAARARRLVELVDGRVGQLVFAPSSRRTATRVPRHGDASACGVRFLNGPRDRIERVPVVDIVRFVGRPADRGFFLVEVVVSIALLGVLGLGLASAVVGLVRLEERAATSARMAVAVQLIAAAGMPTSCEAAPVEFFDRAPDYLHNVDDSVELVECAAPAGPVVFEVVVDDGARSMLGAVAP